MDLEDKFPYRSPNFFWEAGDAAQWIYNTYPKSSFRYEVVSLVPGNQGESSGIVMCFHFKKESDLSFFLLNWSNKLSFYDGPGL